MASQSVKRFKEEMRDFWVWARWAQRSDEGTIRRICGLTHALSIPTAMMGLADRWDRDETGAPIIYEQDAAPEPPAIAYGVQDFMEKLQAGSPAIHRALVARHLKRVGGEVQPISSESQMAMKLYCLDRPQSHTRFIRDCEKGYETYRLYLRLLVAA